ncbi:hypothetical protein P3T51_05790 [Weissella confusa]|uniref:hypothetical protein n=1 Tax=Weissella confusa TaxID=1583 RepID=UPI0024085B7C|nr:hypothetical protein [Weissella confusa]WEY49233.1 hypothetical protein P3T51_05790 [Weissella confusa]
MVNDIEIGMTLARLQAWVARDSFSVVDRQAKHAQVPNRSLIKLAVRDMGADVKLMDSFFGTARCRYPETKAKKAPATMGM